MKRDLRFTRFYPHAIEKVWRALTDKQALGQWMMETDFEPIVGRQFQFHTDPGPGFDGIIYGEVLLVEAPVKLAYSFRGGNMKGSTVTWTLTSETDGTRVQLHHTGFTGLSEVALSAVLGFGWRRMFRKLHGVLATLPVTDQS